MTNRQCPHVLIAIRTQILLVNVVGEKILTLFLASLNESHLSQVLVPSCIVVDVGVYLNVGMGQ